MSKKELLPIPLVSKQELKSRFHRTYDGKYSWKELQRIYNASHLLVSEFEGVCKIMVSYENNIQSPFNLFHIVKNNHIKHRVLTDSDGLFYVQESQIKKTITRGPIPEKLTNAIVSMLSFMEHSNK